MTEEEFIKFIITIEDDWKLRLLHRMQMDCNHFLGNDSGHVEYLLSNSNDSDRENCLWAKSVGKQILFMRIIYADLATKPAWISLDDIDKYDADITNLVAHSNI